MERKSDEWLPLAGVSGIDRNSAWGGVWSSLRALELYHLSTGSRNVHMDKNSPGYAANINALYYPHAYLH